MKKFLTSMIFMAVILCLQSSKGISNIMNVNSGSANQTFSLEKNQIDTLESDAIQERFFTGATANENAGTSVATAGDVNGDGFEDIIIGAPNNDAGGSNAGRAYIYFGGMIVNTVADVLLTGAAANDNFGISVSSAGDVNGDGYSDVIVGANFNDAGGNNAGRAYIFYGGENMNNTSDVILTGAGADNSFGYSVSSAGEVNGDGFADVIVGAYLNNAGGVGSGRAYIFYGGASMNTVADVTMTGAAANDNFAYSVSGAGDVNGDGYADVIAGAMLNDAAAANAGRAYIFFGGAAMNSAADVTLSGAASNDYFGLSVSSAGDINGDGFSDVITGAPYNDVAGNEAGRAYVFFGGAIMNNTADITLTGAAANDNFGYSVSSAGDMNGDGFSDAVVGAYGNDAGSSGSGRAYVYSGGENTDNIADAIFTGAAANDNFGISVSSAGDINGDGFSEVLSGASNNDAGGSDAGRTYLYMNSLTGTDIEDMVFTGVPNENLGSSVSSAGDVNGDGYDDFIVGAFLNNGNRGAAYIYFGGSNMDNTYDVMFTSVPVGDQFGNSVSGAGDVNGDGYDDVIIGAPLNDAAGGNSGRAYIYYGGASMDVIIDVMLTGESAGDAFGTSVSDAGDVNGDGYADVVVGAPNNDFGGANVGRTYIFFGGAVVNNTPDILLDEGTGTDYFGSSVSSAGDMNGDGYGDLIIGALNFASRGAAYIYFGGEFVNNNPDLAILGEINFEKFGCAVSTAGDVNGDGYSDVIVGSYGYPDGDNKGRAYLYLGGIILNNSADASFTGELSSDGMGFSLSDAGDVNSDGYADIIISSPYNNAGGSSAGRTYVFFGSAVMNNAADIIMTGKTQSGTYGYSVSGAGDVNGDGKSDIITGAYLDETGGTQAGRAFLHMSSSPVIQPGIVSVKDVMFDQGGYVSVKWIRSGYDINGQTIITGYLLEKSVPPGISGYSWQSVATIPATKNLSYTYLASTTSDSMTANTGTTFFRVTAQTSQINQYWRSNIKHGYSVDNLSPDAPLNLSAFLNGDNVILNWNASPEPDFHHYIVYRNNLELNTSLINSFDDLSVLPDSSYDYTVAAADIHGNISPMSNTVNINFQNAAELNLSVMIQGFYRHSVNSMFTGDTVTVYLRNSSAPYASIDSSRSVLNINGEGTFSFNNASDGVQYYIQIKHRNSIETWSSGTRSFTASSMNYDFTNALTQAYGNNLISIDNIPSRFGIYSGDVNQDGTIDGADGALVDNDAANFEMGYIAADITGDNLVDGSDAAVVDNNSFNFVTRITP